MEDISSVISCAGMLRNSNMKCICAVAADSNSAPGHIDIRPGFYTNGGIINGKENGLLLFLIRENYIMNVGGGGYGMMSESPDMRYSSGGYGDVYGGS